MGPLFAPRRVGLERVGRVLGVVVVMVVVVVVVVVGPKSMSAMVLSVCIYA